MALNKDEFDSGNGGSGRGGDYKSKGIPNVVWIVIGIIAVVLVATYAGQ